MYFILCSLMSLNKCFHVSAFVNTLTSCMPPCERAGSGHKRVGSGHKRVGSGHKRAGFGHKTRYKQASKAVIEV